MSKVRQTKNIVREWIVKNLTCDLLSDLATRSGRRSEGILKSLERKIRRGKPGLSKEYLEEEVIRRLAKEISEYNGVHPDTIIESLESQYRDYQRRRGNDEVLRFTEYHFPISETSYFASQKMRA